MIPRQSQLLIPDACTLITGLTHSKCSSNRANRINPRSPPSRTKPRQQRNPHQNHSHPHQSQRIESRHPIQHRTHQPRQHQRPAKSQHNAHQSHPGNLAQHHPQHTLCLRPQRHANPNLPRPRRHRVRHNPVAKSQSKASTSASTPNPLVNCANTRSCATVVATCSVIVRHIDQRQDRDPPPQSRRALPSTRSPALATVVCISTTRLPAFTCCL